MVHDHPTPSAASYAESIVSNVVRQIVFDLRAEVSDRTSLKKLTKLFVEKLDGLAQTTRLFMEHAGRTQPSIQDVLAAFPIHRIDIQDLIASERDRPPLPIPSRYQFPVPHEEDFHMAVYGPKPSDRELRIRPDNIPSYHRAIHPEWCMEKEDVPIPKPPKIVTVTEEEFREFKKPKYPWDENPDEKRKREEKDRQKAKEIAHAKSRNKKRYEEGITAFKDTDLPNFEDMAFVEVFEDLEYSRMLEAGKNMDSVAKVEKYPGSPEKEVAKKDELVRKIPHILKKPKPVKRSTNLLKGTLPMTPLSEPPKFSTPEPQKKIPTPRIDTPRPPPPLPMIAPNFLFPILPPMPTTPPARPARLKKKSEAFDPSPTPKLGGYLTLKIKKNLGYLDKPTTPVQPVLPPLTWLPERSVTPDLPTKTVKLKIKFGSEQLPTTPGNQAVPLPHTPSSRSPLKIRISSALVSSSEPRQNDYGKENGEEDGTKEEEQNCPICHVEYEKDDNMVACDKCEGWFHWHCVGITVEPKAAHWYCSACVKSQTKSGKRRGRPSGLPDSAKKAKK
ncbi:Protein CBG07847 [Caenorhabditis briggsae]|uniref:Protein CBG07847 n=1 Tax=Caenorhabditis briggsae TaxID=6238 RepID=A8X595_CAEBR|nr:Protein CBG07847 [Caenorhabditis briggsae]CAP27794.1 Protein CBG07847 [Caenorhabditis briggsae]